MARAEVSHPTQFTLRPRTNPQEELSLGFEVSRYQFGDVSSVLALASARYGLSRDAELSLQYGFTLREFETKGGLVLGGAYDLLRSNTLSIAADASFGYNLLTKALLPVRLGLETQVNLLDTLTIGTRGQQLSIALEGDTKPIDFILPVTLTYQVQSRVAAGLGTTLMSLGLAESSSMYLLDDYFPFELFVMTAISRSVDLGANVTFVNLQATSDIFYATLGLTLHL